MQISGARAATRSTARGRARWRTGSRADTRRIARESRGRAATRTLRRSRARARSRRAHKRRRAGRRVLPDVPRRGRRRRPAHAGVRLPRLGRVDTRDLPGQVRGGRAITTAGVADPRRLKVLPDAQAAFHGPGTAAARGRAVGEARALGGDRRQAHRGGSLVHRGARRRGRERGGRAAGAECPGRPGSSAGAQAPHDFDLRLRTSQGSKPTPRGCSEASWTSRLGDWGPSTPRR